jgi:hypothetical protein
MCAGNLRMDWYRAGRLKFRETVAQLGGGSGGALIIMLSGDNTDKQMVRLAAATQ